MAVLKFKDPDTLEWKTLTVVSDGVTFIPSIDENGELTWSNNGHLDNPDPIKLDNKEIVFKPSKDDFPAQGVSNMLYVATRTGAMFIWDENTSAYVAFSGGGTIVEISKDEGNIIQLRDDGLYVPSGLVQISKKEGNSIKLEDDGLYASASKLEHSLTIGNDVFDGTKDIVIGVYNGEVIRP